MTPSQAQSAIKMINAEMVSLTPSALIELFEIDIGDLADDAGITFQISESVFRFHNNIKLINTSIFWQGNEFIAAPIQTEGFEINAKGVLPTPKLTISVDGRGITLLAALKQQLEAMGDLVGGKVTRIRTFARYLDARNFYGVQAPKNFSPNPNSEFPRDVFFIDRKVTENKTTIQFQLASLLDIEGVSLPTRMAMSNRCPFSYRGCGCLYEYDSRRNISEHGNDSILPRFAPAVANINGELIANLISVPILDKGQWDSQKTYFKGDQVFITKAGINYYFVASSTHVNVPPPNGSVWISDACSKDVVKGCKLRYGTSGAASGNITKGNLPFGGYPGISRLAGN